NEPHKCLGRQFLLPQVADIAGLASDETERTHAGIATERARFVVPPTLVRNYAENMLWEDANVMQYLRAECGSEIGTNEHCFRLANPNSRFGSSDQFEANLAFDTVMTGEINRRAWVQARSIEWLAAAVAEVVTSCELAIEDCVKNTCGFGSMASCYGRARNRDGLVNLAAGTVNDEIARICRPQIAENQHCRDLRPAGESATAVWTHFWGAGAESTRLSARLSSQLQNAFSETGKANMRRACQTAATACVRQECGNDFTRCLVRGADDDTGRREFNNDGRPIIAGAQAGGFSQDMARGLCMLTVKEIRACNDWFDIQFAESAMTESGQWGALDSWTAGRDARNAWGGDNRTHVCVLERMPMIEAEVQAIGDMRMFRNLGVAARRADVSENDFGCAMQGRRIFDELIADIAAEAQQRLIVAANEAKNQCLDRNRVRGLQDNFVWANVSDLRDRFNPVQGILVQDIRPTADIWDGFCAVRITMNSDDTILNNHLSGVMASRNVRYFSVGDAAVCGSWMSQSDLESLEDAVRAANPQSRVQKGTSGRWMGAITGILGGGAGGIAVGNMIGNAGARDNCTTRGGTSACNMCGHQIRGTDAGDVDDRVWYTCDISIIGNEVVVSNRETSREPPVSEGGGGRIGDTFIASTLRGCNDAVDNLLNQCNAGNRNRTMQLGRHGITGGLVGAAGLGAVGLIAGNQIDVARQRTAQEEERLKQDAAVAEWFNTIGSRINCFIDGRQVGRFGDPIEIR
ncbi:MAG: hypothetical protein FWE17_02725, partial [Alphaproteobacteria bacterium]|nr:hypothetical protein [Alphaproteobacteria bacterium]